MFPHISDLEEWNEGQVWLWDPTPPQFFVPGLGHVVVHNFASRPEDLTGEGYTHSLAVAVYYDPAYTSRKSLHVAGGDHFATDYWRQ